MLNWGLTPNVPQDHNVVSSSGVIPPYHQLKNLFAQRLLHNDVFEKWIWIFHSIYDPLYLH